MNATIETISSDVYKHRQSWRRTDIIDLETNEVSHRLKLTVHRDAYDDQSRYTVERWDGSKWNFVLSVDHSLMPSRTRQVSYVSKDGENLRSGLGDGIDELEGRSKKFFGSL